MTDSTLNTLYDESVTAGAQRLGKVRASLWTMATIIAPLAIYFVFSGVYMGAWYARTRHQGAPPPWLIEHPMFIPYPPALWVTVGLWWLIHRRHGFRTLFGTHTKSPAADVFL